MSTDQGDKPTPEKGDKPIPESGAADSDSELDFSLSDELDIAPEKPASGDNSGDSLIDFSEAAEPTPKPAAKATAKTAEKAPAKVAPKPTPAVEKYGKLFDLSGQIASTARKHVEAAYKGVTNPDDQGQRAQALARLRVSLLGFCEKAVDKKILTEDDCKTLVTMANVFAQNLLLSRAEGLKKKQ